MPYGKKPYRYVLSNRLFEVRLAERMSPSCHVQFFSEGLWKEGLNALVDRFRAWCGSMGLNETRPEVVARADWAFDYHLPVMDIEPRWFVHHAQRRTLSVRQHQLVQTFQFLGAAILFYGSMTRLPKSSKKAARRGSSIYWGQGGKRMAHRVSGTWPAPQKRALSILSMTFENYKPTFSGNSRRDIPTLRRPSDDGNRSRWPYHELWSRPTAGDQRSAANRPHAGLGRKSTARLDGISGKQGRVWICREQAQESCATSRTERKKFPPLKPSSGPSLAFSRNSTTRTEWHDAVKHRVKAYRVGQ